MKIQLLQDDLNRALGMVSKVVTSRGQLAILGNVLIEAEKGGVRVAGTNLEMGIRVEIGGKVEEEGAITVPARNLAEFVGAISTGNVMMETDGEKLKVRGEKLSATFAGIAASEFPVMSGKGAKGQRFKVSREIVLQIAREVAMAAAQDESRPVYTGVKLQIANGKLQIVGTDGFRMGRLVLNTEDLVLNDPIILPAKTILELARLVDEKVGGRPKNEIEVELREEENLVIFKYGKIEMLSRVLEGNFPDVDRVIPTEYKTQCVIDREELLKEVRAVAIFARENNNVVKLIVHSSELVVKAAGGQLGEAEAQMEAEVEGEEVEVAFNFRYVMDFLVAVDGERVTLRLSGSLTPGVWGVEGREDLIYLVMPVRI